MLYLAHLATFMLHCMLVIKSLVVTQVSQREGPEAASCNCDALLADCNACLLFDGSLPVVATIDSEHKCSPYAREMKESWMKMGRSVKKQPC